MNPRITEKDIAAGAVLGFELERITHYSLLISVQIKVHVPLFHCNSLPN